MRIYRASELGGCIKAQVAKQLGFTPLSTERFMSNLAHEGELHEDDLMKKWGAIDRQKEVTLDVMPSVQVMGHIDGYKPPWLLEVKTMGDEPFKAFKQDRWDTAGLVQKYKWQISVYMLALSRPCKLLAKNRNTGEVLEVDIEVPFYSNGDILRRVVEMERWVRRGELPPECSVSMFPCPFYYLESQLTMEVTEDTVMDELARMYQEASVAVKAAETRKREARKALDQGLAGRERVVTALSKITYYEVKAEKIDFTKMAEDGIDVNKYKVVNIGKRLRVTVKDEGKLDEGDKVDGENESRGDGERTTPD